MYRPGLNDLDAVVAIARRGSFRAAALELGMSTSALSNAIGKLEASLGVRLFHRTAVPHLLASKLLRLFGLQVEGRTVAAYYGFEHRGESYAYLNGFDPDWEFESPGTALLGTAIRHAIANGSRRFHFLRGQEPYKYAWGAEDRWNVARTLRRGSQTSKGRIHHRLASYQGST